MHFVHPLYTIRSMDDEQKELYRKKLEDERAILEDELSTVGERNPANPDDWVPVHADMDTSASDSSEQADASEAYGENATILNDLEVRHTNVTNALERLEDGTYGVCSVCGEDIEHERLEANVAADTCIAHREEEGAAQ